MRYFKLLSILYFAGIFLGSSYTAPFIVPNRYPTRDEVIYNKKIPISSQPITEADIFIERGVLQYLVNKDFFNPKHLHQWNRLAQLTTLTPRQAIRMVRLKKREARALHRFQRATGLPRTGIIDTPVIRIVFPVTCGTPDYVDEPFNDDFGDYNDLIGTNNNNSNSLKRGV